MPHANRISQRAKDARDNSNRTRIDRHLCNGKPRRNQNLNTFTCPTALGPIKMNLGIVIPLKSKRVSRQWKSVVACLEGTLNSLKNQSCDRWFAVVVGHEKPEINWGLYADKVKWVKCLKELPTLREGGDYLNYADFDRILDKYRKISLGMRFLEGEDRLTDWFVLDADDLVHRDFVRVLRELPSQAGWVVERGYLWYKDLGRWKNTDRLLQFCGSTTIIRKDLFKVPQSDHDSELKKIPWCRLNHSEMIAFLSEKLGGASPSFPLDAIAYTLSHGDNCSDEFRSSPRQKVKLWIKKRLLTKPIESEFKEKFGL